MLTSDILLGDQIGRLESAQAKFKSLIFLGKCSNLKAETKPMLCKTYSIAKFIQCCELVNLLGHSSTLTQFLVPELALVSLYSAVLHYVA